MKLKKLEIFGFKSFADKTKLEFNPGITAVVGPNGCGKSNIADAFRWVLGEQSAKSMRGNKMFDIIFSGTNTRKPLNIAEVSLTLTDIEEGVLPLNYDEVVVTRRLHRSGESEYLINKVPVRLKDIQNLFLDSGVGKDAYSIFEQGKIDEMINLSPLERRYIFEEAAGILRFLHQKKEAFRKLEQINQNITRVRDIYKEVESRIIILQEQADKAKKYKQDKATLEDLERDYLFAKWSRFYGNFNSKKESQQSRKIKLFQNQALLIEKSSCHDSFKEELSFLEEQGRHKREQILITQNSKELKIKEKQNQRERFEEIQSQEGKFFRDLELLSEQRSSREKERKRLETLLQESEVKFSEIKEICSEHQHTYEQQQEDLFEFRTHYQSKTQELLKLSQEEKTLESEAKQKQIRIENFQEKILQIQSRRNELLPKSEVLKQEIQNKKLAIENAYGEIDIKKEIFASLEEQLNGITEAIQKYQIEISALQDSIANTQARSKALQRLKEDMEGYSSGSKKLLTAASDSKSPFYNKIKNLYEYLIPKEKEDAVIIASAMNRYLHTLVVETEEILLEIISYIKQHGLKDVSLLCLETLRRQVSKKEQGISTVNMESLLSYIVENEVSHEFLGNTYVCDSIREEILRKVGKIELLTEEGLFIDLQTVISYPSSGENNLFLREAELKKLEESLKQIKSNKHKSEEFLKSHQQQRAQLQAEAVEIDKIIRREEMRLIEVNFSLQKMIEELEKISRESMTLKAQEEQATLSSQSLDVELERVKSSHSKTQSQMMEVIEGVEVWKQKLAFLEETLKKEEKVKHTNGILFQQLKEQHRNYHHLLEVLSIKDKESEAQHKRALSDIEQGKTLKSQIEQKEEEFSHQITLIEGEVTKLHAEALLLQEEISVKKRELGDHEKELQQLQTQIKKEENEEHQIALQVIQLESVLKTVQEELQERHHLTIPEAEAVCKPLSHSLEETEKKIRSLRNLIEQVGDINMKSIEECEEQQERYQFLKEQLNDLTVSQEELSTLIDHLNQQSKKIFQSTFYQIAENFKKNFSILFNGGEADLQFTENKDILEAGIEIIAKPPGKQMRSISLLSGGEKCLTAMALLFAIFEVKPSPFCILDEIDAPLDDTNVERFAAIVKEYMERCQFVIITHNKRTMAIADVIFGVSMEEKGVSKLLSLDFSRKEVTPSLVGSEI